MDALEAGRRLAERHCGAAREFDPSRSLLNYAEIAWDGDWTLRSALVRLAQPDPARVGALLDLMRRVDAPLHHVRRALERHSVTCDRHLTVETLGDSPVDGHPDARTTDLARLVAAGVDETALLTGYQEIDPLDHEERMAVPLLAVAVDFEGLAEVLAAWALVGPSDPPLTAADDVLEHVAVRLDELGVPVETGPPPGVGRSRRS